MRLTQILLWQNMLHEKIWSRALISVQKRFLFCKHTIRSIKSMQIRKTQGGFTSILFVLTVKHSSLQKFHSCTKNTDWTMGQEHLFHHKKDFCFANTQFWYIKKYANTENQEDYKVYYLSLLTIVRYIVSQLYKKYWLNNGSRTLISSQKRFLFRKHTFDP
jgi:hypothetical protein